MPESGFIFLDEITNKALSDLDIVQPISRLDALTDLNLVYESVRLDMIFPGSSGYIPLFMIRSKKAMNTAKNGDFCELDIGEG